MPGETIENAAVEVAQTPPPAVELPEKVEAVAERKMPYDVHFHALNKEAAMKHLSAEGHGLPEKIKMALQVMLANLDGDAPVEVEANNHDENWGHHHLSVRHIRLIG